MSEYYVLYNMQFYGSFSTDSACLVLARHC